MKTMLNIGDYALHKTTGKLGQVVAYGHEIIDSVYHATLKVEVVSGAGMSRRNFVEDLSSQWLPVKEDELAKYKIAPNPREWSDMPIGA
ncbi:MAG TPA: hypothetical protein V6D11_17895 [Waterburya sp.]|jgi:hypothetical protein